MKFSVPQIRSRMADVREAITYNNGQFNEINQHIDEHMRQISKLRTRRQTLTDDALALRTEFDALEALLLDMGITQ